MRALSSAVIVLMLSIVPVVASAQNATPDASCSPSALEDGKLVPQFTDVGLVFSGEPGDYVSQPFELPEGNVIYNTAFTTGEDGRMTLEEAPRSTASGGGLVGTVFNGEALDLTGVKPVYDAGEFVLEVHSDGPWSLELEF